jgi:hypothetical protein
MAKLASAGGVAEPGAENVNPAAGNARPCAPGRSSGCPLLGEFGKERGPPFLECLDLGPELFQLAVDALQLGLCLLLLQVSLTMPGADQLLDLAAEQPQPRIPLDLGAPVLKLARADRRDDLVLR